MLMCWISSKPARTACSAVMPLGMWPLTRIPFSSTHHCTHAFAWSGVRTGREAREPAPNTSHCAWDVGRNLFAFNRAMVSPADQGALSISCGPPARDGGQWDYDSEYELGNDPHMAAEAPHESKDA